MKCISVIGVVMRKVVIRIDICVGYAYVLGIHVWVCIHFQKGVKTIVKATSVLYNVWKRFAESDDNYILNNYFTIPDIFELAYPGHLYKKMYLSKTEPW